MIQELKAGKTFPLVMILFMAAVSLLASQRTEANPGDNSTSNSENDPHHPPEHSPAVSIVPSLIHSSPARSTFSLDSQISTTSSDVLSPRSPMPGTQPRNHLTYSKIRKSVQNPNASEESILNELSEMRNPTVQAALTKSQALLIFMEAFKKTSVAVRNLTVEIIADTYPDSANSKIIIKGLEDPSREVRQASVIAIPNFVNIPNVYEKLMESVENSSYSDVSEHIQHLQDLAESNSASAPERVRRSSSMSLRIRGNSTSHPLSSTEQRGRTSLQILTQNTQQNLVPEIAQSPSLHTSESEVSPRIPLPGTDSLIIVPNLLESNYHVLEPAVAQVPEIQELQKKSKARLQSRLNKFFISSDKYNLKKDYEAAEEVLKQVKSRPHHEGMYKLNYDFIAEDPYLYTHSSDIHQLIPFPVSDREWLAMRESFSKYPDLPKEAIHEIFEHGTFFQKGDSGDTPAGRRIKKSRELFRKRFKRIYTAIQNKENKLISEHQDPPLFMEFGLELFQHLGRCLDGMHECMTAKETDLFQEGDPENAGDFISRVLTDYKMNFIEKHGQLDAPTTEFHTYLPLVLKQRMLYSLGLRGTEMHIRYASNNFDLPHLNAFQPAQVMARFLAGETLQLPGKMVVKPVGGSPQEVDKPKIKFEPYNLDLILKLLRDARERGFMDPEGKHLLHPEAEGVKLKSSFLQKIAQADPTLSEEYLKWITDPHAPNLYFQPALAEEFVGNIRLTDRFWLHLLEAYGYILR